MKITTIVMAAAFAVSSGCAFAAGGGGSSAGARGGISSGVASHGMATLGGISTTMPGITTGMGTATSTGVLATPGLNANGPCNGASSTTAGGAC
jgi:hypothetical protein